MKLIYDATELSYYNENSGHKAGVYYVSLNLLKELEALGLDITLCCDYKRYYFLKNLKEFQRFDLIPEMNIFNKFVGKILYFMRKFPLKIQYIVLMLARFYDAYLCKIDKSNLKILNKFDVYFSPFAAPSLEIQKSGLKKFRMIHDVIPIIESGFPKSPRNWAYKIYNSISAQDFYVTNSDCTRKDVLRYFPFVKESNIKTTLLAANENFYQTKEKPQIDGKYIFSLCTLGKRKNLIFAIENFYSFIHRFGIDDLKLVLGGSVWKKYEKELNAVLKKYDPSKVVLTGYIEEQELRKFYSNALCFIYPSLYEGFGLPVLEAMQCSCPVITSNISSLPEVLGECGILIDPKDNESLISAYEKMYFDQSFRTHCAQRGLERSKIFSWKKCALELIEFIEAKCV